VRRSVEAAGVEARFYLGLSLGVIAALLVRPGCVQSPLYILITCIGPRGTRMVSIYPTPCTRLVWRCIAIEV
jgi:malonyl CoA-acyl carrier protein transacylase